MYLGNRLASAPDLGTARQYAAKLVVERVLAGLALLALAPLLAIVAISIRLDSPGPALFRQWRIGYGGHRFQVFKFRSMRVQAEAQLARSLNADPHQRRLWSRHRKLPQDPRLTKLGRVLRRYSLDELPQLWNVVRGEMSLIGPRPILLEERSVYGPALACYTQVLPGMTGLWQVNGRNHTTFAERARWDEEYVRCWSLGLDLSILARTPRVVVRGDGAY